MYIKIRSLASDNFYSYVIYAANHKRICESFNYWQTIGGAVRAAIKLAIDLGIEFREN